MIAPRVHMNGDRKETLQEALYEAAGAIRLAQDALRKTSPNARNYYVIDSTAFERARAEHIARVQKLELIYDELLAIFSAIDRNEIEATITERGF